MLSMARSAPPPDPDDAPVVDLNEVNRLAAEAGEAACRQSNGADLADATVADK